MPKQQKSKQQKGQKSQGQKSQKKGKQKAADRPLINLTRPWNVDAVFEFAKSMDAGETPKIHIGIMSQDAHPAEWNAHYEAVEAGKKAPPLSNLYQPSIMQYAKTVNALAAQKAQGKSTKSRPAQWNENKLGKWELGFGLGDIRCHHAEDARKLVVNPDENLLTVGRLGQFVVGTTDTSAIHLIHASKTGCFGAIIAEGKKLAAEGVKGLDNLVGRFNDKVVKETLEDGSIIVWLPNQQVTWGYLVKGDRKMTCAQIRNLGDDVTGVKFEPLPAVIRLNNVTVKAVFSSVKRTLSLVATKDEAGKTDWDRFTARKGRSGSKKSAEETAVATNAGTLCRLSPKVLRCQGFKSLQLGMPIFHCFEGDSVEKAELVIGFAIGCRLPDDYAENTWDMRGRLGIEEEEPETETTETAAADAKPKKAKGKSKGKSKSKKSKVKPAATSAPTDAPVSDTAEDAVETESAEDEDAANAAAEQAEA